MRREMRKATVAIAAGVVALSVALAGCSPSSQSSSSGDAVLRVWAGSATPINHNFNPVRRRHRRPRHVRRDLRAAVLLQPALERLRATGLIGDSYEYSEDGKTLTVKIKPDLKWNDGEPLTADDVVFTFGYGSNKSDKLVSAERDRRHDRRLHLHRAAVHVGVAPARLDLDHPRAHLVGDRRLHQRDEPRARRLRSLQGEVLLGCRLHRRGELVLPRRRARRQGGAVRRTRLEPVRAGPAHHRQARLGRSVHREPRPGDGER